MKKKSIELFDLMAYFAGYGFNKSHSAAYALIAYQTAYLKANFKAEFMACLISLESTAAEQMAFYVSEAKEMGIEILPPDINNSEINFSVVDEKIRFGLLGIKNVGLAALENIIHERSSKNKFKNILDLAKRIDLRTCNKRVFENLIAAGALDSLSGNRAQKTEELPKIIEKAAEYKKSLLTGQMGLFETSSNNSKDGAEEDYMFQDIPDWPDKLKLEKEKEVMGLYVSSQPLDYYTKHIKWLQPIKFQEAVKISGQETIVCIGAVKSSKVVTTKKGDRMAFMQLEDTQTKAEIIIFPKLFSRVESLIPQHTVFIVTGNVDESSSENCKLKAQDLIPADTIFDNSQFSSLTIEIDDSKSGEENLKQINSYFSKGNTPLSIVFYENGKKLKLNANTRVAINLELLELLDREQLNPKVNIITKAPRQAY